MFNFIFLLLIIIGIIGIIYIYKKYANDIKEDLEKISSNSNSIWSKFQKIVNAEKIDKIENKLVILLEKILRRSRVIVLRIDNTISNKLTVIRKKQNIQQEKQISFSGLNEKLFFKTKNLPTKVKKTELELLGKFIDDRNNLESYKNLARFYLNQNEYRNCRHILLEALAVDPQDKIISDLFVTLYEKIKPEEITVS